MLKEAFFTAILVLSTSPSFAEGIISVCDSCQDRINSLGTAENLALNVRMALPPYLKHIDPEKESSVQSAQRYIGKNVTIKIYDWHKSLDLGYKKGMMLGCEGIKGKLIRLNHKEVVMEVNGRRILYRTVYDTVDKSTDVHHYKSFKKIVAILPSN